MRQIQGQSWLDAYMDYTSEDEAPELFRYWSGVSALSSSLKRKLYTYRGRIKVFPNHYIVLVGPPGIGKGNAMRPAIELVREANTANMLKDRVTAEKVADLLAGGFQAPQTNSNGTLHMGLDHCATAVAPELSVFLSASDWYLQFLCQLWDENEFDYNTKKGGLQRIKENCFGLVSACTPDYIRKINKDNMAAIGGGFTSRTIFAYSPKKGKSVAWPKDVDPNLKQKLVEDLKYIANLGGTGTEISWTPEAKKFFVKFYNDIESTADDFEMEVITNFKSRMWSHAFKLAMVLSVSESDSLIIEEKHMKEATRQIYKILSTLDVTFRGVGESDLATATDRIMDFIEKKGRTTRSEIMRYNYRHVTSEDLDRILQTLLIMQFCFEKTSGASTIYEHNASFDPQLAMNAMKAAGGKP